MPLERIRVRALGLAPVHTPATARARIWLALFASVVAALCALPTAASATIAPSTFQGNDANQTNQGALDWEGLTSPVNKVTNVADNGGPDSQFTSGKEEEPNAWNLITEPGTGVDPSKSDFKNVFVSTESGVGSPAKDFLYLAFFRGMPASGGATTFLTFELNRVSGRWRNDNKIGRASCRERV